MNTNAFKSAGFAAIALAILFPVYWLYAFGTLSAESFEAAFQNDLTSLNGWDVLFVIIGALEIAVYVALAKLCRNQLNGNLPAVLLIIMAVVVGLFHATVVVDITLALGLAALSDTLMNVTVIFGLICLFLYAVVAFIFAISMLIRFAQLSMPLKVFSVGLLIACVFQFTVVLGIVNIFLFPVLLIVLAIQFFRGDHEVEVV
ncbi:hypothetical protein CWE13_08460 [Aliidiomarina shirensis]|uniref:DUF4386 domain-containing protein n=1 Tax=Aliidiomarina shirensis TaxID=1048642 RepID=A0A432WSX2_9GAMM|nr:hypothetical protein [Aliidiomarina shirensis]RUO36869.1 hypothetical protein CWE13_08460 [Aliidiomarina shirensis]